MSLRALKWLVGVMGVLIVVGTVALVAVIVQRLGSARLPVAEGMAPLSLRQPEGTRIAGMAASGERLAIWVVRPDGERVLLVDPRNLRPAGEVRLGE
ncbi:DUF6476 family protein [Roseomonas sp. NAR14]|uniref:DUF6476 family protein n=1 Tax=Roseomonas acroporae TaxID=2937791 RepID=A0A9X2BWA7_9PROT|nr:DUF6476 family protein [Roseomonas acroporae]MCK8787497.1 DUF6476 family protein [Roseomonas acroporae]